VILVVDDDDDARDTLGELLRLRGYDVESAAHGQAALDVLATRHGPPDLMLIDIRMPIMDGWELLSAKNGIPSLRPVPVIIMTAEADAASRLPAPSVVALMAKPLRAPMLLQVIRDTLEAGAVLASGTGSVAAIPLDPAATRDRAGGTRTAGGEVTTAAAFDATSDQVAAKPMAAVATDDQAVIGDPDLER
jgi:CheY-like chemotaxis protein